MLELGPALSLSIAPLIGGGDGAVRRAVETARRLGFTSVQLSAATSGIRPRELDHRARRDLAALLARNGVALGGLDLMIPAEHWADPAQVDRAVASTLAAVELAADLGHVPLSIALPIESLPEDVTTELLTACDGRGVALAVHAEHDVPALRKWLDAIDQPLVGAALDPATLIASPASDGDTDHGPVDAAFALGPRLIVARLDDFQSRPASLCPVGHGSLKLMNFRAALSTCPKLRSIVVDPRGLTDPGAAAAHARTQWDRATGAIG